MLKAEKSRLCSVHSAVKALLETVIGCSGQELAALDEEMRAFVQAPCRFWRAGEITAQRQVYRSCHSGDPVGRFTRIGETES